MANVTEYIQAVDGKVTVQYDDGSVERGYPITQDGGVLSPSAKEAVQAAVDGVSFSSADEFQVVLNEAATRADVQEITTGITLFSGTTYWVSMAAEPENVFVNFHKARKQQSAAIMRGSFSELGDGGRVGQILWAYDAEQSRLYVRGIGAVTHIATVKYSTVKIGPGNHPGPVTIPRGVRLVGAGMDATTVSAVQAVDYSIPDETLSYALRVRSFSTVEDLAVSNIGGFSTFESASWSTAVLYPFDQNTDCVQMNRVRTVNTVQSVGRQNSVELACNYQGDNIFGRGLLWNDCEFYAARSGLAVETISQMFKGWGVFTNCRTYGHNWLDGAENTFEVVNCTETNILPNGEVVLLSSFAATQGAILSGHLAPFSGRQHVVRYIGSQITAVRAANNTPIAMMVGDDTGDIIFDGTTVQCDTGPLVSSNTTSNTYTALTHQKLAQFIVRRSNLPMFRVQSLSGSNRLPMGLRIQTLDTINSVAGTGDMAGWTVDNSKELNTDWEFVAVFSGTFAGNTNGKQLVLQAGPVGSLVTAFDMTSLAANGGAWELTVRASRLGNPNPSLSHQWKVSSTLVSTNTTVGTRSGNVTGVVPAGTNLQFNIRSTGVATADIVMTSINVDGKN